MANRKTLSLSLAAAVIVSLLALANFGALAQDEIVITYADTMSSPNARPGEGEIIHALLDLFMQQNPGIRVEVVWGSGNFDVQYLGGASPDVARFTHEPLRTRAAKGMLLPLDDLAERDGYDLSLMFPAVLNDGFRHEGKLYGIPMYFGTLAMHYNTLMFQAAGLPLPNSPGWSWERDFVDAGLKLARDRSGDGVIDQWITAYHHSNVLAPFMAARGAEFVSNDLRTWKGTDPVTIDALQWMQDQIQQRGIIAYPGADRARFVSGDTAVQFFGSWGLPGMQTDLTFEWGLAEMPMSTLTGRRGTRWNADGWAISNQTKHPEAAWKLVKFIGSTEAQEIIARGKLGIPPRVDIARDLFSDPTTPQDETVFINAVDYMWIDKRHELPRGARDYIEQAIDAIVKGEKSARAALEEITSSVEEYIKSR